MHQKRGFRRAAEPDPRSLFWRSLAGHGVWRMGRRKLGTVSRLDLQGNSWSLLDLTPFTWTVRKKKEKRKAPDVPSHRRVSERMESPGLAVMRPHFYQRWKRCLDCRRGAARRPLAACPQMWLVQTWVHSLRVQTPWQGAVPWMPSSPSTLRMAWTQTLCKWKGCHSTKLPRTRLVFCGLEWTICEILWVWCWFAGRFLWTLFLRWR